MTYSSICTITSTSTAIIIGKTFIPTALRACLLFSSKTETIKQVTGVGQELGKGRDTVGRSSQAPAPSLQRQVISFRGRKQQAQPLNNQGVSFSPHSLQNLLPTVFDALHLEHLIGSSDLPHDGQNFASFTIPDPQY
jgi:hypothetical protein